VLPRLIQLRGAALDFLFPQKCVGCGEEGTLLCRACQKSLSRITPPVCPKCGKPQPGDAICPGCSGWHSSIDGIRSPLKFEGLVRTAIHQFKYKNLRIIARPLAILMSEYLTVNPLGGEVLVPVPLHPRRLRERGYNQSELLARELGKLIPFPVISDCLIRHKYILPQAQTHSVEERHRNVNQAFACQNTSLQKKQVLLIDDVSTSGATLDACAMALKSAGAISVWGLVLAREIEKYSN
jgi:ComF family protein